jgi:hypothetical protein
MLAAYGSPSEFCPFLRVRGANLPGCAHAAADTAVQYYRL